MPVLPNPLSELDLDRLRTRRSAKWQHYPPDVLPMWVAEMDTPLAPPVRDALLAAVDRGDTGYESAGQLPEVFAAFAATRFGWRPDPAGILLVPDVMHGISAVLHALTPPGSRVVINPPVYHPFFSFLRLVDRRVVECPLVTDHAGRWSLDLDRLAECFAEPGVSAYLMCNPHNPTGTVFTAAELAAVAELSARHRVRVLADEIHAPLVYPGAVHVPYLSLPDTGSAVVFTSASKAWNLPGLKSALAVAGPSAAAELRREPVEAFFGSGIFGVIANEVAFRDGGRWLDALLAGLDANRHRLATLLAAALPAVRYRLPDATYLAWLDCRGLGLAGEPADVFLDRGRVAVNAGPMFGTPGADHVRLNFATPPELLAEGVRRMAAAVSDLAA
jgi:cysteine-S-conjugate beta-lyase